MAKQRHDEPTPAASRNALIFLSLGGIAVAALVVWALTRTVDTTTLESTNTAVSEPGILDTTGFTPPLAPTATTPTATMPTGTTAPTMTAELVGERSSVKRIAAEDLREQINANAVTVLDVRDAASYATGHIPGSLHIPLASIEGMISTVPKGKPIVAYCT